MLGLEKYRERPVSKVFNTLQGRPDDNDGDRSSSVISFDGGRACMVPAPGSNLVAVAFGGVGVFLYCVA